MLSAAVVADAVLLPTLLATAAAVGVGHTLVGPDHYLPIAAAARAEGWSRRRTIGFAASAGLLHCLASLAVAVLAWLSAAPVAALAGVQEWRGSASGWAMVGVGLVLVAVAWRRRRETRVLRPVLLALFLLGPCEWLLPNALAAAPLGLGAVLLVGAVFTACTVATMLLAVVLAGAATARVGVGRGGVRFLPGVVTAGCGALVLLGL